MYYRVTTFEIAPEAIDKAIRDFRDVTLPIIRDTPGWAGSTIHVNREKGIMRFIGHFASREALDSTLQMASNIRSDAVAKNPQLKLVSVETFEEAFHAEPDQQAKAA